ncbi:hypothetical protein SAMN05421540_1071 [Psychroflexus halocasei]|uniref:Uncharacterized protein n=1 Tax=Psychroflexus halocasei TaxID=908615 RepID=A0A1H4C0T0_9FLAO|nr:hypothetical protein SAMN05421540_1071 [Psychroflexus halocasei]
MKNSHFIFGGTAGGTILSVLPVISSSEIFKTIILASLGAAVSFMVSYFIKSYFYKKK